MIETPEALKTYLKFMLSDYCSVVRSDETFSLEVLKEALPVLIAAQEHYAESSEEFLKFGETIPQLKKIVDFYEELILLFKENYTRALEILLHGILGNTGVSLVRMDDTHRSPKLLKELEDVFYETLLDEAASSRIAEILVKLTKIFEEIPSGWNAIDFSKLPKEFLTFKRNSYGKALTAWYENLDEYWVEESFTSRSKSR